MEIKKVLGSSILPAVAFLATSCGPSRPDISNYLETQCELTPNLEVASQRIEMVQGQQIDIAGHGFELNRFGKLNRTDLFADKFIEVGEGYITKSYFGKGRFHLILSNLEQSSKTALEVSCNCADLK